MQVCKIEKNGCLKLDQLRTVSNPKVTGTLGV